MKYTVGSLFAGIGGICYGFRQAGFEIKWANEWDKHACKTYRHNFKHHLEEGDINLIKNPKKDLGYVDVVTSGFPCQAFSVAGYRKGFKDPRGNLFFQTARFIDNIKPKAFLLENVANLTSHDNGKTFSKIKNIITEDLNYSFIPFVLNSCEYTSIPQNRLRLFIVGFRNQGYYQREIYTGKKDLNLSKESCNNKSSRFRYPCKSIHKKKIKDIIDENVGNEFYYNNHRYFDLLSQHMNNSDTFYQYRRGFIRENRNNCCPTLTANMGTGGHNVPLMVLKNKSIRKLTPEECIKFQGFPKSFKFSPKVPISQRYKQAGNSVVVPFVKKIAIQIKNVLS